MSRTRLIQMALLLMDSWAKEEEKWGGQLEERIDITHANTFIRWSEGSEVSEASAQRWSQ